MAFTVAIVGRPNVGKSTLFNRLVGRRAALVAPTPGVTRDRREGWARIGPLRFRAIDTAGLEEAAPETLAGRMMAQTERALADADAALLLIDGRAGVTPADEFFANQLRRLQVPIILAVNKCEGGGAEGGIAESHALGLGQPIPISAEHGEGLADLYDALSPFDSEASEDVSRCKRRAPARRRRAPQCWQVDAAQPAGGRGAGHHRRGAGAHAGFDRGALVLRGPRGRAGRYRGHAPPRQDRGGAGQALFARRRARPRPGGGGARRAGCVRARRPSGHGHRRPRGRRRPGHRHPAQQVGSGAKSRRRPRRGSGPAGGCPRPGEGCSGGDLLGPDRRGDGGDHADGARRLRYLEPPRAPPPSSTVGWKVRSPIIRRRSRPVDG